MRKDKRDISILIVEDHPGDMLLVEDFLDEVFLKPTISKTDTFGGAKKILESTSEFDVLLLDLGLPDLQGVSLIDEVDRLAKDIPKIILTGYVNLENSLKLLSRGVSDYLIKDELNSTTLYKSIVYSIQRTSFLNNLKESKRQYSELFHISPQPMWVYDLETLKFLDVNKSALTHYGYTENEFLNLSINDIRPVSELLNTNLVLNDTRKNTTRNYKGIFKHLSKDGSEIIVEIHSNYIRFKGKDARLVLASDITEKQRHLKAIEQQNKVLREIAWTQSHTLRAPLARIMGLIDLINLKQDISNPELDDLLSHINSSATELDSIIRKIVSKSNNVIK